MTPFSTRRRSITVAVAAIGMLCASGVPAELRPETIANVCAGCHGTNGALAKPGMPELKGREDDLPKALLDFKYDREQGTMMNRIAKGFSDEELVAVGRYFAHLK